MSEFPVHERYPGVEVAELLMPSQLPEISFQSYEELKNNGPLVRPAFYAARHANPTLDYPRLKQSAGLDGGIARLQQTIDQVRATEADPEKADIIATTLEFRMAEMEYIKQLGALNIAATTRRNPSKVLEMTETARNLGEQLYGSPESQLLDAGLNEIWRQIDDKRLTAGGQIIYDQLESGFCWSDRFFPGLPRPDSSVELPRFEDESLSWAGEIILEDNADIENLLTGFWDQKEAESGPDYKASPADIVDAFQQTLALLDPDSTTGVRVILDPDASALSWDTSLMAVKVGGKRLPISSKQRLFQRVFHELKVHGGRAISGLQSGLPVLGTGLYTDTPRPDYLTFEEGFASAIEETIGEEATGWNGSRIGHYVNLGLIQGGADFRRVFETAWRYRLLMAIDDYQEPTPEMIRNHQNTAYVNCIRIFRGTPINLHERYPEIAPLSYNKDLAYMHGSVLAMNYIKGLHKTRDEAGLLKLFRAKYDPTIPEQAAIVDKYM